MEHKITPFQYFEHEAIEHLKEITKTKKVLFTLNDAVKHKTLADQRVKILLNAIEFLNRNPLIKNDYFKFVNSYFTYGVKLDEKYFKHDTKKLHEYYDKIDKSDKKWNPFKLDHFQTYVLFMSLKLNGVYKESDNEIFNVKNMDAREYNPLSKIPSVLRGVLPFKVKEYDIKRAFPSFIDIELNTSFKDVVYTKISKSKFAMFLNANHETKVSIESARNGLFSIYGELVNLIVTDERYNDKGRAFKDFSKYEHEYIDKFTQSNKLNNYARLHDGIFVLDEIECKNLIFDKVEFAVKECITPPIINERLSFYKIDYLGNVVTNPSWYADFLKQENFIRIQTNDDKIQLLKDTNNVVDYFNHKTDLVSFLESEINEPILNAVRDRIARDNNNIIQQSLTLLEPIKLEYYKDSKQSFGLPFLNGFYYFDEVDNFKIKRKEYSEVNGFFSPHQIQKRNFEYTDEIGVFETFVQRIVSGVKEPNTEQHLHEINCFNTMIGYVSHNFKTQSETVCIILTDEGANDETRNGGRGKTNVANGISEVTKTMQKGGNEFIGGYIHNFADLNESYNFYVLDDIPANFNYNDLYTNITGGINIQPKGTKGRMIDFVDSPKFMITTNWLLRYDENDTSTNRRFIEYKIKPYYNIEHTPRMEFNQTFFEDWDQTEWNKFYSYFFRCVHSYLVNGIQRILYDKTEDNYKAMFNSDVKESEMSRILNLLTNSNNRIASFNVSEFLAYYNCYDNPLKNEKLFTQWNSRKLIDAYLKKVSSIKYEYEARTKRWIKID